MISYPSKGMSGFPRVFHEKSRQRSTSKFHHPPGVGQNVAWALTQDINFTQIIDDLWYRDIRSLRPGVMDDFRVSAATEAGSNVITQMLWGHTTHIGCGWLQIDVGDGRFAYPGRWEKILLFSFNKTILNQVRKLLCVQLWSWGQRTWTTCLPTPRLSSPTRSVEA